MTLPGRTRLARAGVAAVAVLPALALAGCGTTTIDNTKAEKLIRSDVASGYKVTSISCPSGVTAKAGAIYTCKLSVKSVSDGSLHSGTVTLHMTNSSGHVTFGQGDFHLQ